MKHRVLLVDDHRVVLDSLSRLLAGEDDMEVVGQATSVAEATELAAQLQPDVVVLDVTMPGRSGMEAVRDLHAKSPESEVVALSMHSAPQVIADMLREGASAYVVKTSPVQELLTAIRTVMTGQTYLAHEIADKVPADLLRKPEGSTSPLSPRERQVLALVAAGKSSKEIAAALSVTTKTIEWHRTSIMDKLGIRSIAELTKYAIRMGISPLDS